MNVRKAWREIREIRSAGQIGQKTRDRLFEFGAIKKLQICVFDRTRQVTPSLRDVITNVSRRTKRVRGDQDVRIRDSRVSRDGKIPEISPLRKGGKVEIHVFVIPPYYGGKRRH